MQHHADPLQGESRDEVWRRVSAMAGLDENGGILPPDASGGIDRSAPTFWRSSAGGAPTQPPVFGVPVDPDRGPVMQLYSGKPFYLLDPRPEEVEITDIAHHLAGINRYNGAGRQHINVAQHSVLVSCIAETLDSAAALPGLLHDAHETYMGDITAPVKAALRALSPLFHSAFEVFEKRLVYCVQEKFLSDYGVTYSWSTVKKADQIACATEKRDLLRPALFSWGKLPDQWPDSVAPPWPAELAEVMFLTRFQELTAKAASTAASAAGQQAA